MEEDRRFRRFALGIFLTSLVTLSFQVALSYEFAYMFWFNVSITVISIAMFGLGVGGVLGYFISRKELSSYFKTLYAASLLYGSSIMLSLYLISRLSAGFDQRELSKIAYLAIVSGFPFLFAGIVLSMGLNYPSRDRRVISYIYFADLMGAGAGSFALTVLLPFTSLERIVMALVLLSVAAAFLFKEPVGPELYTGAALGLSAIVLFSAFTPIFVPSPSPDKFLSRLKANNATILDTRWTEVSRVDVVEYADKSRIRFIVNGNYPVTASTGNVGSPGNERDPRYIMFYKSPRNMLAIGSGGGVELTMGLHAGVERITAVEINPFIIDYMRKELAAYSNHLYYNPRIETVIEDGRTFVHRSEESYDLIENGVIGSNGLVVPSSTVLTFQDAYVYTVEANRDYYRHLSDNGVAVTIIYGLLDSYNAIDPARGVTYYLLRQFNTVRKALELEGVEPERHMAIFRFVQPAGNLQPATAQAEYTFIFKNPLTRAEVKALLEEARRYDLEPLYAPYYEKSLPLEELAKDIPPERAVNPATDDRPFFYHTESRPPETLIKMLKLLLGLTVLFILLPVMLHRRLRFEHRASYLLILYFLCLGLGYILIEAVAIQKLTLFLGRPAYAFQVVLFSMLVFSGIGSFATGRFISNERIAGKTVVIVGVTALAVLLWSLMFSGFIYGFMHHGVFTKILLSIVFIAALATLMGMPFPLGMRLTSSLGKKDVIWMYGVNSAGSVIGSIIGMIIAFTKGFSYSLITGSVLYGLAFITMSLIALSVRGEAGLA